MEGSGATKTVIERCQQKVESAAMQLQSAQKQYDQQCNEMHKTNKELAETLAEIAGMELQEMDLQQTIDVLVKCLKGLSDLRVQWGQVIQFFQKMSNIIDCSLNVTLAKITEFSESSRNRALKGHSMSAFKRDMLYAEVSQVANISHLVNMISTSYTEMSEKCVMPRLNTLDRLMGYHPYHDKKLIEHERKQLMSDCKHDQESIENMIEAKQLEYHQRVRQRIQFVKTEMESVHPDVKASIEIQNQAGPSEATVPKKEESITASLNLDDYC